jgi:hypothetical protein
VLELTRSYPLVMPRTGSSHASTDTTGWYRFPPRIRVNSVGDVNVTTEPETLGELIADCAHIPSALQVKKPGAESLPLPREAAAPWSVDDACHAQVADLDAYV